MKPHDDDILEGEVVDGVPRPDRASPPPRPQLLFQLPPSCLTGCLIFILVALAITAVLGWAVLLIPLGLIALGVWLSRGRFKR